jgi:nucleotide-binding universal stress UspA family protein
LLVPIDLSPGSDRVLGRVALLPLSEDAHVTLLHVVPGSLPHREQQSAARDAKKALTDEAKHLAKSLPRTVRIERVVKTGAATKEIATCAGAMKAELIVMGRNGGRALRDMFLGSTAERVIRLGRLPVLVVRLPPRAAYRRPAVALDLDLAAHTVLALLLRVIQPPRPGIAIIHAFDVPYEGLIYPSLSQEGAQARRSEHQRQASRDLAKRVAAALARAKISPEDTPYWNSYVRLGSPLLVIQKFIKKEGADLLVLGTHGYRGVAHALLGTIAGQVLRAATCDVLIVPPATKARVDLPENPAAHR